MKNNSTNQVLAVEASAGSGKTYALAKRYVQLLLNPSLDTQGGGLKTILALTFTNKATIEMKSRILGMLKKIALDSFKDDEERKDILGSLGMPQSAASQKAHVMISAIIRNYNYFQVQTIHSFINAILSGCALKLGLSSEFEISEDDGKYLAYGIDTLIEGTQKDNNLKQLFKEFIQHYLRTSEKPSWFPNDKVMEIVVELYSKNNKYGKEFKRFDGLDRDGIKKLKASIYKHAVRVAEAVIKEAGVHKQFSNTLTKFAAEQSQDFSFDKVPATFSKAAIRVNKGCSVPKKLEEQWDILRTEFARLCEAEAGIYFNCYIDIYILTEKILRSRAGQDDTIFLSELNRQANRLFGEHMVDIPELYYRLAARYRHFLLDEFQDTSDIEWTNLEPMVEEALANGGSLYFVGDRKQAVYGFKGGTTKLFDSVPESFARYNPKREILLTNYRSAKEIVEFNNELFSQENLAGLIDTKYMAGEDIDIGFKQSDKQEVLKVFKDVQQAVVRGSGYVRIEYIDAKNSDEREDLLKKKLWSRIDDLQKRQYNFSDIAILARNNTDITTYAEWLIEKKIPVETERTLNIRQNTVIKELISFLGFLHSPIDDVKFASFITGDIFVKASGINFSDIEQLLFKYGNAKDKEYLYINFRQEFADAWKKYIEEFYRNVGHVPLYELAVNIIERYGVAVNFSKDKLFILRFLELIKEREKEFDDIGAFIEYFSKAEDKDLFVASAAGKAVKLMTIHKAKGLQFPVVIVPSLELATSKVEKSGAHLREIEDNKLSLLRLKTDYKDFSERLAGIMVEKEKNELISELCAVYVALTRAKQELYVFIPDKVIKSNNLIRLLLTEALFEKGKPSQNNIKPPKDNSKQIIISTQAYADMVSLLKDEMPEPGYMEDKRNLRIGDQYHFALKQIFLLEDKTKAGIIGSAAKAAAKAYPELLSFEEIKTKLTLVVEANTIKPFFFNSNAKVHNELDIVLSSGASARIDRLMVLGDKVFVIDYKSSKKGAESHSLQVKKYVKAAKELYPEKTVEGYIIYLDEVKAEALQ
jgi:ATP-dependent exoDNAse (exonuclease V) beta subunit